MQRAAARDDGYGTMFPHLIPWHLAPGHSHDATVARLAEIAATEISTDTTDPRGDNHAIPAGYTYLGQFIDHDITFDVTPLASSRGVPGVRNYRTPRLDLDSVYGEGPLVRPELFERVPRGRSSIFLLRVGRAQALGGASNYRELDVPRVAELYAILRSSAPPLGGEQRGGRRNEKVLGGWEESPGKGTTRTYVVRSLSELDPRYVREFGGDTCALVVGNESVVLRDGSLFPCDLRDAKRYGGAAVIADPRNDVHVLISQLHLAFLKFHNRVAEHLAAKAGDVVHPLAQFEEARRITRWHYQWVVVDDFLRRLLDRTVYQLLRSSRRRPPMTWLCEGDDGPRLPIEFSVAAFRMGHSMVRDRYRMNDRLPEFPLFMNRESSDADTVGGRKVLPAEWTVQWDRFVRAPGSAAPQASRKIGPHVAPSMRRIPDPETWDQPDIVMRNLIRGHERGLASGQDIARALGYEGGEGNDPLLLYILREAEGTGGDDGAHLGPVGSTIVGEVLFGLLRADDGAYLKAAPDWNPAVEAGTDGPSDLLDPEVRSGRRSFELLDFLRIAEMPITRADLDAAVGRR